MSFGHYFCTSGTHTSLQATDIGMFCTLTMSWHRLNGSTEEEIDDNSVKALCGSLTIMLNRDELTKMIDDLTVMRDRMEDPPEFEVSPARRAIAKVWKAKKG